MTSSNTPPSGSKTQVQLTSNHPLCSWRGAFPPRQVLQSSLHPNCRATNAPLEQNMWWIIVGRSGKVMSYQHGAGNGEEKRSLFRKGMRLTCLIGIAMFVAAQVFAEPVACIFVSYDQGLYDLSVGALRIYCTSYLFMGFTYFSSSMFTAVENGGISAAIAFARSPSSPCMPAGRQRLLLPLSPALATTETTAIPVTMATTATTATTEATAIAPLPMRM